MPEKSFQRVLGFLDAVIEGRQKVRRREARVIVVLGALSVFLLAPAAVVSQPLFGYSAVVYLAVSLVLFIGVAARAFWIIKRPPARERVALEIESEHPDFGNNLISSLQLFPMKADLRADDPTSPELIDALVIETAAQVESLEAKSFVSDEAPRRLGRLVAALGATAVLMGLLWPGMYPRAGYLLANAVDLMPSRITHLYLSASAKRILPGSSVSFEVRTEGRNPDGVDLEFLALRQEGGRVMVSRLPMEAAGENRFRVTWSGGKSDTRVTARSGRFVSAPVELKVVAPPRAEMVEVVNFPPEYTGLQPERGEDGGNIRAYLGSSVLVRTKPNKPVREALIALADGWKIPLKAGKNEFFEGLLLVGSPGSYSVRLKDFDGFVNLAPSRYRIDIIPDSPPEVKITDPAKDLVVEAGDLVHMRYRAADDFGVRIVHIEVQVGKKPPRRIRLWSGEKSEKSAQGVYVIDVRALGLRPGESLNYRVIAEDTDTVSGPKWGTSPFYKIRIRNREAVIASLDKELNEISSKLLDLLGDYLENEAVPPELSKGGRKEKGRQKGREARERAQKEAARDSLREKTAQILHKVMGAKSMLRPNNPRETLANMDLNSLADRLKDLLNRHLRPQEAEKGRARLTKKQRKAREDERLARQEETTEAIERLASMGEDILRNVRMDRAGRMADAMMRRQESLARALEEMRRSGEVDEAGKRRVEKELARLQQELRKLMQQLAGLAQRMPAEFMNQRGMRNLPMRDMMQAFDRIRQQMARGNIRGALDSLRRLMSQIQRMRNAMRGLQRRQMQAQRGGRPMQRRQSELAAILKEQQSILDETADVFDSAVQRLKKGWPKGLKSLDSRYKKIIREERSLVDQIQKADCDPFSEDQTEGEQAEKKKAQLEQARLEHRTILGEIEMFMEKGEWGEVYRRLGQIERAVQREPCLEDKDKKEQNARWKRGRKWLDGFLQKAEKRSSPKERDTLRTLRKRQHALEGRLAGIEERLRRLMQLYPFIDPSVLSRLSEAKGAMKKAENSLREASASSAIPHEERVLELLAQGQNAMQQSMQQMAQRGRLGMGTPRGFSGMPNRGRGWWARNPTSPGQDISRRPGREGQDGQQGVDFSEVQIPDREQYKVPEKFREEVMEALKEGLPDSLRQEIENYYERLTR